MAKKKIVPKQIAVAQLVTGFVTIRQGDQLILVAPSNIRDLSLSLACYVKQIAQ